MHFILDYSYYYAKNDAIRREFVNAMNIGSLHVAVMQNDKQKVQKLLEFSKNTQNSIDFKDKFGNYAIDYCQSKSIRNLLITDAINFFNDPNGGPNLLLMPEQK